MTLLPTGTVTFLFTDIEGSTKLWQDHPESMQQALARHDALLRGAVEGADGVVFKNVGDGLCAAFISPAAALAAVIDGQRLLQHETWSGEARISVRMALHTGVAELRDGDYLGTVTNRVARLLVAGYGGQALLSAATYELVRDHLPDHCNLKDLGLHQLRDLDRPEQIYQVLHPDLSEHFPPLRTLSAIPNNLPKQLTSFIGRDKAIAEVQTLLAKTSLLTLVGSGGSGKTRLALQSAADVLEEYPGGVWLIELAPLADGARVAQTIAAVLGLKEQISQNFEQTLIAYFKDKRLLLLLDNCEHLLAACARLAATLLRSCPDLQILATSRELLGIAGESTYRVPSLSLPNPKQAQAATVESLSQFEAVRLFIERALLVEPDFAVTNTNAPALAQLCYHLDGIPLAIELAAARIRSLSVEEINDRLDSRFRLLTGGDRSALPRQQTLRALVDWGYDLLNPQEKTLLARLSLFAGGWTLAAAESICGFAPLEEGEVLDLLTSLVDKSLVLAESVEEIGARKATRYRMLETLRQYATEKLDGSGEASVGCTRHRDWFLTLAEQAERELLGREQVRWLARLELEHDNLRAALDGCASHKQGSDETQRAAIEAGLRLAGALSSFWWVRGYRTEGREHLARMIGQARALADAAALSPKMLAKALHEAGYLNSLQGDHQAARALYEESLILRQKTDDKQGIAASLNNIGLLAHDQGDYEAARKFYEESLALRHEVGHKHGIAASLNNLGNIAYSQGNFDAARVLQAESLALRRELGNQSGIATSLNNLGNIAYSQGDYPAAVKLYEESLTLRRELGDKQGIAASLSNLGNIAHGQEDFSKARSLHEECLIIFRELGDKNGIAVSLSNLGNVTSSQGNAGGARSLYQESLTLRRELGDKQGVAVSLSNLGNLAQGQGDYQAARALHEESLTLFRELGNRNDLAYALEGLGAVFLSQSKAEKAVVLLAAARGLRDLLGSPLPPGDQAEQTTQLEQAQALLGEDGYKAAFEHGHALTWEQAADYALAD